ncbi:hypothetical protein ABIA38_003906 [Embleya sp. AB8]
MTTDTIQVDTPDTTIVEKIRKGEVSSLRQRKCRYFSRGSSRR